MANKLARRERQHHARGSRRGILVVRAGMTARAPTEQTRTGRRGTKALTQLGAADVRPCYDARCATRNVVKEADAFFAHILRYRKIIVH